MTERLERSRNRSFGQSCFGPPDGCTCRARPFCNRVLPPRPIRCKLVVTSSTENVRVTPRSNHTRRHWYISISSLARPILLIGLAALTVFVVGPLAGSVDDDGDGSPDIPVVVSGALLFADLSAHSAVDQRSGNLHHGVTSGPLRIPTSGREIVEPQPSLTPAVCVLRSGCCLRR